MLIRNSIPTGAVETLEGAAVELRNTFTIDASIDDAWRVLNTPDAVAPCFPGATLTDYEGDRFAGTVKIKLGPIAMLFKGRGTYVSRDAATHQVVIEASGRDSRGNGSAAATVTASLMADGPNRTIVTMVTDMKVTGRPAQLGRGVMNDVADRIIGQFATCVAHKLAPAADLSVGEANGRDAIGTTAVLKRALPATEAPSRAPVATAASASSTARAVVPSPAASTGGALDLTEILLGSSSTTIRRVASALAVALVLLAVLRSRRGRAR